MLYEDSLVVSRFQPDGLDCHSISNSALLVESFRSFFIRWMKVLLIILVARLALDALQIRFNEYLHLLWVRIRIPLTLLHVLGDPSVLALRRLHYLSF
jgi:hypothetical protein